MQSWIFCIITHYSLVTWSFKNHANMLLKTHFTLLLMLGCFIFMWKHPFLRIFWWIENVLVEILCNIIKVFSVSFNSNKLLNSSVWCTDFKSIIFGKRLLFGVDVISCRCSGWMKPLHLPLSSPVTLFQRVLPHVHRRRRPIPASPPRCADLIH